MKMELEIVYEHQPIIHCESGTIMNFLHYYGYDISETMVIGIGSAIHFTFLPFVNQDNSHGKGKYLMFRIMSLYVCKNLAKQLNFKLHSRFFCSKKKAMQSIDSLLEKNIPVGLVTNIKYLPYYMENLPFNLNLRQVSFPFHCVAATKKDKDNYYLYDNLSVSTDDIKQVSNENLLKARFLADLKLTSPHGRLFFITEAPQNVNLKRAVCNGIKKTCKLMLHLPTNYFGVKGIALLAKYIKKWSKTMSEEELFVNLRKITLMSEYTGTGGSGYRYMYATFLHEAGQILNNDNFDKIANEMTNAADMWREFHLNIIRYSKENLRKKALPISALANLIDEIAVKEKKVFCELEKEIKQYR